MSNQFFYFDPHIFGQISSILVIKQVLYNIFQSTIVTYNFCMIPHSLIFSFILVHFGRRQNPTGLQEAIQGLDKNSMTTLIIKSTLERLYLKKKHLKNHFWNFALFTRFNLNMELSHWRSQQGASCHHVNAVMMDAYLNSAHCSSWLLACNMSQSRMLLIAN